jgi:hypothetical protein
MTGSHMPPGMERQVVLRPSNRFAMQLLFILFDFLLSSGKEALNCLARFLQARQRFKKAINLTISYAHRKPCKVVLSSNHKSPTPSFD